jgi:hypothetical protein
MVKIRDVARCLHGEILLIEWGIGVFIPRTHPSPGVSHFADDPPSSTHQPSIKENKSKEKEFGRQSGRVVTNRINRMWFPYV